jgi:hypothetical protein
VRHAARSIWPGSQRKLNVQRWPDEFDAPLTARPSPGQLGQLGTLEYSVGSAVLAASFSLASLFSFGDKLIDPLFDLGGFDDPVEDRHDFAVAPDEHRAGQRRA